MVEPKKATITPWSQWCTFEDKRIHYIDTAAPRNGDTLLIIHGYLGSTVSFLDLIDTLSGDFRVVMPDFPAFGASEAPHSTYTMEFYLDFLEAFSQAVGLDHYFLMGASMGANIAVHYTVLHPQQVQRLIFLSPFGLKDQAGRMAQIKRWDPLLPLAASLITKRNIERWLLRSIYNDDRVTPELVDAYWRPLTTPEGRRITVEITRKIVGRCSMDELLPQIGQPVLILVGSEDTLISLKDREKYSELLADEQLEIVERSGHFVYLDSPDVVSNKTVRFTRGGM
ncbi:MAG: alpha/beta hydrolase [Spirochaetaceae bacterium]|nr:MAG: alpha/beta hydrolase [Spirochaetaceae bacterium]